MHILFHDGERRFRSAGQWKRVEASVVLVRVGVSDPIQNIDSVSAVASHSVVRKL